MEPLEDTCLATRTLISSGPVKKHMKFNKFQSPFMLFTFDIWTRSNWFQKQFLFVFLDIQSFVFSGDRLPCLWVETGYCLPPNELWAMYAPSKSNQNHHYRYFITTSITKLDNSAQNMSGQLKHVLCYFALICQFK